MIVNLSFMNTYMCSRISCNCIVLAFTVLSVSVMANCSSTLTTVFSHCSALSSLELIHSSYLLSSTLKFVHKLALTTHASLKYLMIVKLQSCSTLPLYRANIIDMYDSCRLHVQLAQLIF